MTNQPFFAKHGDAFIPNSVSNGPWDRTRCMVASSVSWPRDRGASRLRRIRAGKVDGRYVPLPDVLTPVEISTRLIRDGKRIKVVEAEFFSGGTSMARASCQLLRKTENARQCLVAPNWTVPLPNDLGADDPSSA